MWSERVIRPFRTVVSRLTLWHGLIVLVACSGIFVAMDVMVRTAVRRVIDRHLFEEAEKYKEIYQSLGLEPVVADMLSETRYHGADTLFFRIHDSTGNALATSDLASWKGIEELPVGPLTQFGNAPQLTTTVVGEPVKRVRVLDAPLGPGVLIQMGSSMAEYQELIRRLEAAYLACSLALVLLSTVVTNRMVRRAMSGVKSVTQTAGSIAIGDLSKRVNYQVQGEEIEQLATTFNSMLDRIQTLVTGMQEMTDNIAHDLRSPLARIRGVAEIAATGNNSAQDMRGHAGIIVEECDAMLNLVNTLLDLSEAEAGASRCSFQSFDLGNLVRDVRDLFQTAANDRQIGFNVAVEPDIVVRGDRGQLGRVLANLLDNAFRSVSDGGVVTVSLIKDDSRALIKVADDGLGIPEEDLNHIFTRFYRGDRSRRHGGYGLGLSLAAAFVKSHGGAITVSSALGHGSTFEVSLPRSRDNDALGAS